MADIKGIELASDIYGLEDETARGNAETNAVAIGNLTDLKTTVKTSVVAAINELLTPTSLQNEYLTLDPGITSGQSSIRVRVQVGNIQQGVIIIDEIESPNLGTSDDFIVGTCSLRPKVTTTLIGLDQNSHTPVRIIISTKGVISLAGTEGLVQGQCVIRAGYIIII